MAYELIYTSVPNGLQMGSSGFCTAAMTNGLSPALVQKLESLSGYKPCFSHNSPNYIHNPVSYFNYLLRIGGENFSVLGRICSAGLDYTKRSNKLAHFLIVGEQEKFTCPAGPASFASGEAAFLESWNDQPRLFQAERSVVGRDYQPRVAAHWGAYSGDPGWAGWLAQSYLDNPKSIVFVIFDPLRHGNILELVDESLQLLPEKMRWEVTFNTYLSCLSTDSTCNWRFCIDDKETLRVCGWTPQSIVLDLRGKLPPPNPGNLINQARSGDIPQPREQTQLTMSAPVASATNTGGSLSLSELRKKRADEEAAAAAAVERQRQEEARYAMPKRRAGSGRSVGEETEGLSDAELHAWNYRNILSIRRLNHKINLVIILLVCFMLISFALQGVFYFGDYLPIKKQFQESAEKAPVENQIDSAKVAKPQGERSLKSVVSQPKDETGAKEQHQSPDRTEPRGTTGATASPGDREQVKGENGSGAPNSGGSEGSAENRLKRANVPELDAEGRDVLKVEKDVK